MAKKINEIADEATKKIKTLRPTVVRPSRYSGLSNSEYEEVKEWEKRWAETARIMAEDNKRLMTLLSKSK